jgi:hypothetical protein
MVCSDIGSLDPPIGAGGHRHRAGGHLDSCQTPISENSELGAPTYSGVAIIVKYGTYVKKLGYCVSSFTSFTIFAIISSNKIHEIYFKSMFSTRIIPIIFDYSLLSDLWGKEIIVFCYLFCLREYQPANLLQRGSRA